MFPLDEEIIEQTSYLLRARLTELDGEYELACSWCLVQAFGHCCGVDFYFRAKFGEWEFETQSQTGHLFPQEDPRYFVRRGEFDEDKPGAMELEWAARLLRRCLAEWWDRPA